MTKSNRQKPSPARRLNTAVRAGRRSPARPGRPVEREEDMVRRHFELPHSLNQKLKDASKSSALHGRKRTEVSIVRDALSEHLDILAVPIAQQIQEAVHEAVLHLTPEAIAQAVGTSLTETMKELVVHGRIATNNGAYVVCEPFSAQDVEALTKRALEIGYSHTSQFSADLLRRAIDATPEALKEFMLDGFEQATKETRKRSALRRVV